MNPLYESSENPEGKEQFDMLCKLASSENLKENPNKLEFFWKLFLAFYEEYPDFGEFEVGREKAESALLGVEDGTLLDEAAIEERILGVYIDGRFEIGLLEKEFSYGRNFTFSIKESEYSAPHTNPVEFKIYFDRDKKAFIVETIEDNTGRTVYGNIGWNPLYFAAKVLPQKLPFLAPFIPRIRDIPLNTEMRSAVMAKGQQIRALTEKLVQTGSNEEAMELLAKNRLPKNDIETNPKGEKQRLILPLNKN